MILTILDGGHTFVMHIKEDEPIPAVVADTKPPHQEFMYWWRAQCKERNIPYSYRVAEPMGHRIILSMLKKRTLPQLKGLALQLFRDHADVLTEEEAHFAIFSARADKMEAEQSRRV